MSLSSLEPFDTEYSQKLDLGLERLTVQSHQARLNQLCADLKLASAQPSPRPGCRTWIWETVLFTVVARGEEFGIQVT